MAGLSTFGLLLGALFFAFSLAPSLLPRPSLVQGVLSGLSFAAGYGLGVAAMLLWTHLQLPQARGRARLTFKVVVTAVTTAVAVSFLWQASHWADSLRALMGMEASPGAHPVLIGLVAIIVFTVLLGFARLFRWVFRRLSQGSRRFVPRRISNLIGITVAILLFWMVIDGLLVSSLLRIADRSFQQLDALVEPDLPQPIRPEQVGSPASLVNWEDLGRQGRRFVAGGPTPDSLEKFIGAPVPAPIRVYVGLNSADTAEERARLAVEELKRVGGFERSLLLLVTPTGTGWVDPAAQDTVEYLHRGDVATVAAQYSYLNSPLSLLTQAAYGAEMARALFAEVYGHWRTLPRESRPRLFLAALSLGSINSDLSFNLYDIIDDPFDGVLWVGSPFSNETWRRVTTDRDPGSPAWLPEFRGGSVVRFMNQHQGLDRGQAGWGNFRIAFLQYASDPITFFSTAAAWREPDWMREPRGPDVSPDLRWFPLVTMLQLAADMMVGTAPSGFGHEYDPTDYIDAWLALTEPEGWSEDELSRLRDQFAQ